MKNKSYQKGILALLSGSFLFALVTVINRFIPQEIGVFYQLFIKVLMVSLIFLVMTIFTKSFSVIERTDWPLIIFRGTLYAVDFAAFFFAVTRLPLGTTLFLFYAGSVTTSFIYGYFILHEHLTKVKVGSLLLAITGLYFIYSSNLNFQNLAILLAVISGACFGTQTSASKNLTDKYSINQVNLVSYFVAVVTSLIFLVLSQEKIFLNVGLAGWLSFFIFSLANVGALYLTIYGFKYVEAQKASLILLAEIVFASIIGYIFYHEAQNITTVIGGIFIILALAVPNLSLLNKSN